MGQIMSVIHNESGSRFEIDLGGATAVLVYEVDGDRIAFVHTEVPRKFEGRGFGAQLARAGLDFARASGYRVVPACAFIAAYIRRNPKYLDIVSSEYSQGLTGRSRRPSQITKP